MSDTASGRRVDGYSDGPYVAIRVHDEGDHWAIDAIDAKGDYSEAIWTIWDGVDLTKETAIAHALDFAAEHAPGVIDVRVLDGICCQRCGATDQLQILAEATHSWSVSVEGDKLVNSTGWEDTDAPTTNERMFCGACGNEFPKLDTEVEYR